MAHYIAEHRMDMADDIVDQDMKNHMAGIG